MVTCLLGNLGKLKQYTSHNDEPFQEGFKALGEVKKACFSKKLDPNYKEVVKNFEEKWFVLHNTLDVPFTNKVHVIIQHVPEVCERTRQSFQFNSTSG